MARIEAIADAEPDPLRRALMIVQMWGDYTRRIDDQELPPVQNHQGRLRRLWNFLRRVQQWTVNYIRDNPWEQRDPIGDVFEMEDPEVRRARMG